MSTWPPYAQPLLPPLHPLTNYLTFIQYYAGAIFITAIKLAPHEASLALGGLGVRRALPRLPEPSAESYPIDFWSRRMCPWMLCSHGEVCVSRCLCFSRFPSPDAAIASSVGRVRTMMLGSFLNCVGMSLLAGSFYTVSIITFYTDLSFLIQPEFATLTRRPDPTPPPPVSTSSSPPSP